MCWDFGRTGRLPGGLISVICQQRTVTFERADGIAIWSSVKAWAGGPGNAGLPARTQAGRAGACARGVVRGSVGQARWRHGGLPEIRAGARECAGSDRLVKIVASKAI